MDAVTLSDTKVRKLAEKFSTVKLETGKNKEEVKTLQIGKLPTVVFLDAKGTEIHRVVGYSEPVAFIEEMQTVLDGKHQSVAQGESPTAEEKHEVHWFKDLAKAKEEAAKTNKIVFAKFEASW